MVWIDNSIRLSDATIQKLAEAIVAATDATKSESGDAKADETSRIDYALHEIQRRCEYQERIIKYWRELHQDKRHNVDLGLEMLGSAFGDIRKIAKELRDADAS